jgi:hypothetical protein
MNEIMQRLAEPFEEHEVKWRVQREGETGGRVWVAVIAYIDASAVMQRLDRVVGPENWANRFEQLEGGVICGLSIRMHDHARGDWVTKWDGSAPTKTEPFKGGLSGAMKRAAVMWGIGRYLHGMGEVYAEVVQQNDQRYRQARRIKGKDYRWLPPKLDAKYLPKPNTTPRQQRDEQARGGAPAPMAAAVAAVAGPIATTQPRMFAHPLTGRDVSWREFPLPGTAAHLAKQGGKNIGDVPRNLLPEIREKLLEHTQYATVVAAIEEAMASYEASAP